ncbi:MAG: 16S rRNA (uracil(1498)-N(3))-methyltransferase [Xanthomonadales bacterium]|nr:16S rRNA (uracil(1498)-N(3))-methyltransferase [Xanthomonadales bacterium]
MRTIRGYIDAELTADQELALSEDLSNHITRVLRLRVGDRLQLFDGRGREFAAELIAAERKRAQVRVGTELAALADSPLQLTLAQGLCRGEKMDLVLQKATELGVQRVQPLQTERTEVKLDAEREARRMAHWRQVLISACEQSGRARVPELAAPMALPSWLAELLADATAADAGSVRLMLDPEGDVVLRDLPQATRALLAVGPEGGFSEHEGDMLQRAGFTRLRLGPRVLRTETAGLAAIAALQSHWGDF